MSRRVAVVLASTIACAGCVGAGSLGGLAFVALLVFAACGDEARSTCDGTIELKCEAGQMVEVCCPAGISCNYFFYRPCGDTCIIMSEECNATGDAQDGDGGDVSDSDVCDTTWDEQCVDGQRVAICCPSGTTCDYARLIVDCADGTCVEQPEECP